MTAYPHQIIPPNSRLQLVDPHTGIMTQSGLQFLQQVWGLIVNTNQIKPCTCTNVGNVYTLTPFPAPPSVSLTAYEDFNVYSTIASATSTGAVTALVTPLGTKKVYINGGSTQAGAGDLVNARLYLFIYNSVLDSSNGGFVLK